MQKKILMILNYFGEVCLSKLGFLLFTV